MGRVPYTQAEKDFMVANAMKLSLQEIADHLGRTEVSVRSFFNRRRIPTRKDRYSEAEKQYILANAGVISWADIAEKLGRSSQGIQVWASKHQISGSSRLPKTRVHIDTQLTRCAGLFCSEDFVPRRYKQKYCSTKCFNSGYVLRKYSMTKDEWWNLFHLQGDKCVCGKSGPDIIWCVDHDHSCCPYGSSCGKCVRGILCPDCNFSLGSAKDSPEILRRLADYLESSRR